MCEGEKDEKGTKWRRRKPMNPNLIKEPREASLNMYVLCVHLSSRQTPMSPHELGPLRPRTPCRNGWLLRPLRSRKGMNQLGIPKMKQESEFSRPRPPTLAASYSGPGRRDEDPVRRVHGRPSTGSSRTLTRRDTLREMRTDLTAAPHASLRTQILKGVSGRWDGCGIL